MKEKVIVAQFETGYYAEQMDAAYCGISKMFRKKRMKKIVIYGMIKKLY